MNTTRPVFDSKGVHLSVSDGRGYTWKFSHNRRLEADNRNLATLLADEHDKCEANEADHRRRTCTRIEELESRVFAYQGVVGRQKKEIARLRAELVAQSR